jgi:hypothetical protein
MRLHPQDSKPKEAESAPAATPGSAAPSAHESVHEPEEQAAITARELAQALASLDARRLQQQHQSAPVAVEQALSELGIEATPDEVRAEVRRLRDTQAARAAAARQTRRRRRWRVGVLALAGVALAGGGLGWLSQELRLRQSARFEQTIAAYRREAARQTHAWRLPEPRTLVLDGTGGKAVVRTLGEVPEGRTVRVSYKDFYGGERRTASELMADAAAAGTWHVVKHGGRVYLRGWLPGPMSAAALRQGDVWLTNAPVRGAVRDMIRGPKRDTFVDQTRFVAEAPVRVTLPLEGLRFDGNQSSSLVGKYQVVRVVSGIVPDPHLFEPW